MMAELYRQMVAREVFTYLKLSGKEKALVGEYAYNHGVATAI